ncbi:MAG: carboxylesterase family protein [Acidobacteriaceae bacterium]
MKRALLLGAIAGLAVAGMAHAWASGPEVTIDSGRLRGATVTALARGGEFLGIPFAAQPVGELRWRAPQPAPKWAGVREAAAWGPACPQRPSPWLPEMLGIRKMNTSEACLYLNVWTPELHPAKALPVLVWVHGGGNVEGSGEWPPLGVNLAKTGVVVVSFNYRLGAFGFFTYPGLDAESEHRASGNYGHLDQIAALQWVRRNIARFGGDPRRVTIAGQSSGSEDVCILMASPLARGLFEGAILESGTCVDSVYPRLSEEETSGERLAKDLGVGAGPEAIRQLRSIPAERILETAASDDNVDLEPNIDGWVLPEQPAVTFARGEQARVSVMPGTNEDEVSIFASPLVGGHSYRPKTLAEYRGWLTREFGGLSDEVFAAYPARDDAEVPGVFRTMFSDYDFAFSAWLLAKETTPTGRPAYLYRFTYVGSGPFASLGAFHSEELMFLSGRYWTSWVAKPGDAQLARTMVGYWSNFVKRGDPNGRGLPAWPAFGGKGECQELGQRIGPEAVPRAGRLEIFQRFLDSRLKKAGN